MAKGDSQYKQAFDNIYKITGKLLIVFISTTIIFKFYLLLCGAPKIVGTVIISGGVFLFIWRMVSDALPCVIFIPRNKCIIGEIWAVLVFNFCLFLCFWWFLILEYFDKYYDLVLFFKGIVVANFIYSIVKFLIRVKIDSKKEDDDESFLCLKRGKKNG